MSEMVTVEQLRNGRWRYLIYADNRQMGYSQFDYPSELDARLYGEAFMATAATSAMTTGESREVRCRCGVYRLEDERCGWCA